MANRPNGSANAPAIADRIAPALLVAGAVLSTAGFLLAFLYASPVHGASVSGVEIIGGQMVSSMLLLSQKIFYFHMPVAIVSFAALAVAAVYCVRFLAKRDTAFDTRAAVAMEIALLFVICTMITGEMWTRFEWGVWWTWEPRLTTYLILMLITIAYFVLRAAIDDAERRAVYSAVVGIVAFVDVPICFMVTRLIPSSVHPVVVREGGMSGDMGMTLAVCLVGLMLVGFAIYRMRLGQVLLTQRVDRAQAALEAIEEAEHSSADGFAAAAAPVVADGAATADRADEAADRSAGASSEAETAPPSFADALRAVESADAAAFDSPDPSRTERSAE